MVIDNTELLQMCKDCGAVGFIPEITYVWDQTAETITFTRNITVPTGDTLKHVKYKVHDFFGGTAVGGASLIVGGEGYTSAPTITITGNGTGAAAHAVLTGDKVTSIVIDAGGTGYTTSTMTFSGGGGYGAKATTTMAAGAITGATIVAQGTSAVVDVSGLDASKGLAVTAFISTVDGINADGGAYGIAAAGALSHWDVDRNATASVV